MKGPHTPAAEAPPHAPLQRRHARNFALSAGAHMRHSRNLCAIGDNPASISATTRPGVWAVRQYAPRKDLPTPWLPMVCIDTRLLAPAEWHALLAPWTDTSQMATPPSLHEIADGAWQPPVSPSIYAACKQVRQAVRIATGKTTGSTNPFKHTTSQQDLERNRGIIASTKERTSEPATHRLDCFWVFLTGGHAPALHALATLRAWPTEPTFGFDAVFPAQKDKDVLAPLAHTAHGALSLHRAAAKLRAQAHTT